MTCSIAQLPRACTIDRYDGTCCPTNEANEVCSGRGICVNTSNIDPWTQYCEGRNLNEIFSCPDSSKTFKNKYCKTLNFLRERSDTQERDFRYNWPAQIFTRICHCTGNYAGYDCSRCKRGYGGPDCTVRQAPVVRRSFLDLSPTEKNRIIEILNMAKTMPSDFTVPLIEQPTGTDSFKALSLYDVFATFHYYTIRDEGLSVDSQYAIPDFAHEGPAFLPWHRAYLLYFETELQYMLNDPTFALPYWDWTAYANLKARNDDACPDIFSSDLFGENDDTCLEITNEDEKNDRPIITNNFNWRPICTNNGMLTMKKVLCNPYENDDDNTSSSQITRCIGSTLGIQGRARGMLPTQADVEHVIDQSVYDVCDYSKTKDITGFRNALEGFYNFNNVDYKFAEMHNKVHLYIGGLMKEVPTSSNDPIFWLHHCNVDRLYEKWLENTAVDTSYKPTPNMNSVEFRIGFGHNGHDNVGLMFPPITNLEAHKPARELGYSYQDPESCTTDATTPSGTTQNPNPSINPSSRSGGVKAYLHQGYMVST